MGKRRDGRLAAVQFLFANDVQQIATDPPSRAAFWSIHQAKGVARDFAEALIDGVIEHRTEIDEIIGRQLENFRFERLAVVDRNVLRLAGFELLYSPDLPTPIIMNEAIEVAKILGGTESGSFVNGVLDRMAKTLRPPASTPAP
ncbi:MAG: transcription antitermination factor NusB [Verrucomicrobiales bacterium]|nr:transcription antitermination factor NusB [Verrucomicrobiales bacterium]